MHTPPNLQNSRSFVPAARSHVQSVPKHMRAGVYVTSWAGAEAKLAAHRNRRDHINGGYESCQLFRRLKTAGTKQEYWAMIDQHRFFDVMAAGFYLLKARHAALGCAAALRLGATLGKKSLLRFDLGPYPYFLEHLKLSNEQFKKVFGVVAANRPRYVDGFMNVVYLLPASSLAAWFYDRASRHADITVQAAVAGRLFDHLRSRRRPVPLSLIRRARTFALVPGYPRFVYLFLSRPGGRLFRRTLKVYLRAGSTKDISIQFLFMASAAKTRYLAAHLRQITGVHMQKNRLKLLRQLAARLKKSAVSPG